VVDNIRVLLADNKEVFREGLARLLEEQEHIEVVLQCSGAEETVQKTKDIEPDVVLINTDISDFGKTKTAQKISKACPGVKVAMLTDSESEEDLFSAIEAGAIGYLLKDMKVDDLMKSIDLIAKGEVVVSPPLAGKLVDKLGDMKPSEAGVKDGLSEREQDILKLLVKGSTNKEIAEALFIAENTAKVHIKSILEKLRLRNRQQAAAYAVKQGLATEVTVTEETTE
jgi:NarL family two-component system response regulator LiaR